MPRTEFMEHAPLREPKGPFQRLVRRLAEEALTCTHHDADEIHAASEINAMERRFTNILRGYLAAESRRRALDEASHDR